MMTKEESTEIVMFKTPGAGVLLLRHGHIVKMHYFFSSFCTLGYGLDNLLID